MRKRKIHMQVAIHTICMMINEEVILLSHTQALLGQQTVQQGQRIGFVPSTSVQSAHRSVKVSVISTRPQSQLSISPVRMVLSRPKPSFSKRLAWVHWIRTFFSLTKKIDSPNSVGAKPVDGWCKFLAWCLGGLQVMTATLSLSQTELQSSLSHWSKTQGNHGTGLLDSRDGEDLSFIVNECWLP